MSQNVADRRDAASSHVRQHRLPAHEHAARLHALVAAPWPTRASRLLAVLWTLGLLVLIAVAVDVRLHPVWPLDQQINADFQGLEQTPITPFSKFLGDLAGPVAACVEYVIVLGLFGLFRLFREMLCTAVAGIGAEALNLITNTIVARPRPPTYHGHTLFNLGSHSFPSGHTANAVGLFGFLFFLSVLAQRAYPKWRLWLRAAQVLCIYFVIDVGISRVLEGQHWPSDVVAGYLVGALMLLAGIALYHRLARRAASPDERPASRTAVSGVSA